MIEFKHISVMLEQTIEGLNIKPDGIYVDGTTGGAGHSYEIAKRLSTGRLICIDQDPDAIKAAGERLKDFSCVTLVKSNFSKIAEVLDELGIKEIDGLLLDLGVSSYQLDNIERGFSYHGDAPLDMRMSKEGPTAADLVNTLSEKELADILFKYADEKYSFKIAAEIVRQRKINPITTTKQLADIISRCYPASKKRDGHPARKSFQALRISVNDELQVITRALDSVFPYLKKGGRIAVITFHSIEDRLVKQSFAALTKGCECPPDFPVCVCGKTPKAKHITKKPIEASKEEVENNPRSRSAKLRIIEKI
jgi:16S rRNA (cytosine1402-N4)-methyltransferase